MRFLYRRLLLFLLQWILASLATFAVFSVPQGDHFTPLSVEDSRRGPATTDALRRQSGLHASFPQRYAAWFRSSLAGDFGISLAYRMPVRTLITGRISSTLQIAIPALLLAWMVALLLAFISARFRWTLWEPGAAAASTIPDVVAVSLLLWAAVWAGLPTGAIWLPLLTLTLSLIPTLFLHAASNLRQAYALDFVQLARARGVRRGRLWLAYVLPAAANPLISLAGLSLAAVAGSSFLIEVLTGWPGLGPFFLEAVQSRDYPVVQTILVGLAMLLAASNFIADLVLYWLDPRIRTPHV